MPQESQQQKDLASFWMDFLRKEFEHETDRGAVVLTASLLENALTNLLKNYLVPTATEDTLLEGSQAPLSSFSAKIQIAYRLGLISTRLTQDLNLVRKMRNEFAHNVHGSTLESGKIKDLLTNFTTSSGIIKGHAEAQSIFPPGSRGQFLMVANIILFDLHKMVENNEAGQLEIKDEEWFYDWKYTPRPSAEPVSDEKAEGAKTDLPQPPTPPRIPSLSAPKS